MKIDKKTSGVLKENFLKRTEVLHIADHIKGHIAAILLSAIDDTNRHFNITVPKNKATGANTMVERKCRTCGKTFATYPYWRMTNCEECRKEKSSYFRDIKEAENV